MNRIKSAFPILQSLAGYNLGLFKWDLIAGLTLASFILPESMAYASLAGLPSQYGIYCCIIGGLFFALFTSSRQLAVGPTSAISLMVGTSAAMLSGGDPVKWMAIASLTSLTVFLLCIVAYFLKLSVVVNFIGDNILLGFKTGAALSIASTQFPKLLGIEGNGNNFIERIYTLLTHIQDTNLTILIFGIAALVILVWLNKRFPGRPLALLIVIVSLLVITAIPFFSSVIPLVGDIPAGLPRFSIPSFRFVDMEGIFELAIGCFLIGYIETTSAARTIAEKHGADVDPRQELLSMGAANLAVSFVGGYPVSGGLSQSTINDKAGAKTSFSLIICSFVLIVILLLFTGVLRNLPEVILTVIVLDAISGLIKI
ncbi:MAG: SulP family inorganic anion transporter, partial [Bacteroidota bacterium]